MVRQSLRHHLVELVGTEEAALLMHYLPPVGWADVATKRDLDFLASQRRAEMAVLRSDLHGDIAELRGEVGAMRGKLQGEIRELRGEVHGEIAELRGEIRGRRRDLRGEFRAQTTRMLIWLVPTVIAGMGVAARLG